ncbi:putative HAMP domain-containing sensor [Paenibacillus mucilaginosus 3016]|uniref:Putative HAMP domain-containing sensor n=1 Tax=Paenibacillus mucilaginosus 3016 TaxID=1116391 RepID=H6NA57_9BACL|nr:sensor histidine kinase [Paenibacillus mucilaginosus]AFC28901.1 putative HAMP domain-containing sensor [Paenibacillus mucilaginosus 3016]WFA17656.1 sensor histidine kinase [Paenibacillus mucilaginosus]
MYRSTFSRLRKSIFAKFTLSFILVGLLPLLALSYLSLNTFSGYMERYTVNNYEQMLLYAGRNVDDMYAKYNNISKVMYSYGVEGRYGHLGEAISAQKKTGDYRLASTVDDFLRTVLYTDSYLQNIFFVFPDGTTQRLTKENKSMDFRVSFPAPEWKTELLQDSRNLAFFPSHKQTYHTGTNPPVMTFARNLLDISMAGLQEHIVGTLYMDVGMGAFDEIFGQLALNPKDTVYVLDGSGNVLYSNRSERIGQVYTPAESGEYLRTEREIAGNGWKVVGEIYKEELFRTVTQMMNTVLVVILLCAVSLLIVALLFSRRFSGPIRSITREMTKVESGNFDTRVTVKTDDEIGLLGRGFNKMVVRLQSYIDEVYVAQIKQKQAELSALKSQIRPHYLYNTLEVIRMSAVANDDQEVGDMILSLSHQLKYVLDYGQETVTLLDEKSNIEQYFRLMVYRYGEHRLSLDFRFDAGLLGAAVPKLSIQPLVENAVYHGIMPKSGKGNIRITAELLPGELLCITVDDDGVGMTEETLEKVRSKLGSRTAGEFGSIGLKNVHDRIQGLYGGNFGIEVSSSRHIGTSIRMTLPYQKEGNADAERHIGG